MNLDFDTLGRIFEELFKGQPQARKLKGIDGTEIGSITSVKCTGFESGAIRFVIEGNPLDDCFCGQCLNYEKKIYREIEITEDDIEKMLDAERFSM